MCFSLKRSDVGKQLISLTSKLNIEQVRILKTGLVEA